MTNVIDTILNTSATDGVIKYKITHADSTTENVQIDLATPVQTQGTAINKALFDSIQADLTSLNTNKLNISSKATTSDAQNRTDDTKYMTSLKTNQQLKALVTQVNFTGAGTIFDFTNATGTIVEIQGIVGASTGTATLQVQGQFHNQNGDVMPTTTISAKTYSQFTIRGDSNVIYLRFDLTTNSVVGSVHYTTGSGTSIVNHYDWLNGTMSAPAIQMSGTSSICNCTITQNA